MNIENKFVNRKLEKRGVIRVDETWTHHLNL